MCVNDDANVMPQCHDGVVAYDKRSSALQQAPPLAEGLSSALAAMQDCMRVHIACEHHLQHSLTQTSAP